MRALPIRIVIIHVALLFPISVFSGGFHQFVFQQKSLRFEKKNKISVMLMNRVIIGYAVLICIPIGVEGAGEAVELASAPTHVQPEVSQPRVIRSAPNGFLEKALERMQRIARVANGIALQQSIDDGSFVSDDVFSELLRMGQLKPSDIKTIDVAAIQKALESIADLELPDTHEVDKFFELIEGVGKAVEGMEDVTSWKKKDFEDEMKRLDNFGVPFLTQMSGLSSTWTTAFRELTNVDPTKPISDFAKGFIQPLKIRSEEILGILYSSNTNQTYEFEKIQSVTSGFSTVSKATIGSELYGGIDINDRGVLSKPAKTSVNTNNFKTVETAAEAVLAVRPILVGLRSLYEQQTSKKMRALNKTIGFPNGYEDLGLIYTDLADSWVQKVVKTPQLSTALQSLTDLRSSFENTASSFGKLEGEELKQVNSLLDLIEHLSFTGLPNPSAAEEKLRDCVNNKTITATLKGIDEMKEIATELIAVDVSISEMNSLVWKVKADLETADIAVSLRKTIKLTSGLGTDEAIQDAIKSLKSNDALAKLFGKLNGAHKMTNVEYDTVKGAAGRINSKLASLEPFLKDVSSLSTLFKCIQDNSPAVKSMMEAIKKLRALKKTDPMITKVVKVVDKVKGTAGAMDALVSRIAEIKKSPSKEAKLLAAQQKLAKHSVTIGTATRGASAMVDRLKNPLVFDEDRWVRLIETEQRRVVTPLDSDTLSALKLVARINRSVGDLDDHLKIWRDAMKEPGAVLYQENADIFREGAKVGGIDLDFLAIRRAVETLMTASPDHSSPSGKKRASGQHDTLEDLKVELDALASVHLRFSDYKTAFQDGELALKELDGFFIAFAKAANALSSTTAPTGVSQQGGTLASRNTTEFTVIVGGDKADSSENNTLSTVLGVIGGCVVIVGIGIVLFCCWKRRTDDEVEGLKDDNRKTAEELEAAKKHEQELKVEMTGMQDEQEKMRHRNEQQNEEYNQKDEEAQELKRKNAQQAVEVRKKDTEALFLKAKNVKVEEEAGNLRKANDALVRKQTEAERVAVIPMEWKMVATYCDGFAGQVRKCAMDKKKKMLKKGAKGDEKPTQEEMEEAFEDMFNSIFAILNTETNFGKTKDLEKYHREIRHHGQVLINLTKVEITQAPKGWFHTKFMHANFVTMPNNLKMILCQAPLLNSNANRAVGNMEKFLWMIYEQKTKFVVMLCNMTEDGVNKCDPYFVEQENEIYDNLEHLVVKCLSVTRVNENLIVREQLLTYSDGKTHQYTHLQYVGWPDHSAPVSPDTVIQMLKRVRASNTPVVVHCSAGIGRSGAFALIELGYQIVARSGQLLYSQVLGQLRMMRAGAVQEVIQLAFAAIAVMEYVLETGNEEQKKLGEARRRKLRQYYAVMHAKITRENERRVEASAARTAIAN